VLLAQKELFQLGKLALCTDKVCSIVAPLFLPYFWPVPYDRMAHNSPLLWYEKLDWAALHLLAGYS